MQNIYTHYSPYTHITQPIVITKFIQNGSGKGATDRCVLEHSGQSKVKPYTIRIHNFIQNVYT